jgi:hypothetical protein
MSEEPRTLKPTPASQWKRPAAPTQTVALPSGNVVRMRVPNVLDLLRGKGLPAPLSGKVAEILALADEEARSRVLKEDPAQVVGAFDVIDELCRFLVVEPRIAAEGEEPGEGEIALDWLSVDDRLDIIAAVVGGSAAALSFPGAPGDGALDRPTGAALPVPSE